MKRKRFIQLLMANGYQRNQAVKTANEAMGRYGTSYKDIWENPVFRLESISIIKTCKAFVAFGIAAIESAKAITRILDQTKRAD